MRIKFNLVYGMMELGYQKELYPKYLICIISTEVQQEQHQNDHHKNGTIAQSIEYVINGQFNKICLFKDICVQDNVCGQAVF